MLFLQLAFGEMIGIGIAVIVVVIILVSAIRVIREYERAVVFRLGRLIGAKGPGLIILVPIIDKAVKVDLRVVTLDVPRQRIITLDNVTVDVDAVIYLRVADASDAVIRVNDYLLASSLLAQTTLRDLIGQVTFDDILSKREDLNKRMQAVLDAATDPWGVKVTTVAIRDVTLPENMHRAIAKQAEAEREKRGRIIIAEGELKAAEKMSQAATYYTQNMAAMRLRELQTWTEVARERNMVVVTGGGGSDDLGTMIGFLKRYMPDPSSGPPPSDADLRMMIRQELMRLSQGSERREARGESRSEGGIAEGV